MSNSVHIEFVKVADTELKDFLLLHNKGARPGAAFEGLYAGYPVAGTRVVNVHPRHAKKKPQLASMSLC